jgi:hypothetical protein
LGIIVEDDKGNNRIGEKEEGIGVKGNRRIMDMRRRYNRRMDIREKR